MPVFVYRSAQEHVNNEVYQLEVLEGYTTAVPEIMIEGITPPDPQVLALYGTGIKATRSVPETIGGLVPMRLKSGGRLGTPDQRARFFPKGIQREEPSRVVRANLTIAHMIDMASTDKYCKILHDKDVLEIFHTVDSYLNEVRPLVDGGRPDVVAYVKITLSFRAKLFKLVNRLFNIHPSWRDAYWSGTGAETPTMKALMAFIGMIDGSGGAVEFDPIDRIRHPPYIINEAGRAVSPTAAARTPVKQMTEEELRSTLGPDGVSKLDYGRRVRP